MSVDGRRGAERGELSDGGARGHPFSMALPQEETRVRQCDWVPLSCCGWRRGKVPPGGTGHKTFRKKHLAGRLHPFLLVAPAGPATSSALVKARRAASAARHERAAATWRTSAGAVRAGYFRRRVRGDRARIQIIQGTARSAARAAAYLLRAPRGKVSVGRTAPLKVRLKFRLDSAGLRIVLEQALRCAEFADQAARFVGRPTKARPTGISRRGLLLLAAWRAPGRPSVGVPRLAHGVQRMPRACSCWRSAGCAGLSEFQGCP